MAGPTVVQLEESPAATTVAVAMAPEVPPAPPKVEPPPMAEMPMVAVAPEMPKVPEPETPKVDPKAFVPPTFPSVEEAVNNWTAIPRGAFTPPRAVKVMKPVEFIRLMGGNKIASKVPAGGVAYATGQDGLMITVAISSEPGAAATQVNIDDTDLKAVLTEAYDRWKVAMTERAKRAHEYTLEAKNKPAAGVAAAKVPAGAPQRNAEGTYDILLASMKAGKVTDLTPTNVTKWHDPKQETIDGKVYWTIMVDATVKTMFGPLDAQAVARIIDGQVEKWMYTSGEEVP